MNDFKHICRCHANTFHIPTKVIFGVTIFFTGWLVLAALATVLVGVVWVLLVPAAVVVVAVAWLPIFTGSEDGIGLPSLV